MKIRNSSVIFVLAIFVLLFSGCNLLTETDDTNGKPEVKEDDQKQIDPSDIVTPNIEKRDDNYKIVYVEETSQVQAENRVWPTAKIWLQKKGSEPEVLVEAIGGLHEYPIQFVLSPDEKTLLINLESKLVSFDMQTKALKTIFIPKKQVNDIEFSKDSKQVMIWDQIYAATDFEYYIHTYNFSDDTSEVVHHGDTGEKYLFVEKWLEDKNILLLLQAMGEASKPFYFDLSAKKLIATPNMETGFIGYTSSGKYLVFPSEITTDPCNEFMGGNPSIFELRDSLTGQKTDQVGMKEKVTRINAFSPDGTKMVFSTYAPDTTIDPATEIEKCNTEPAYTFYLKEIAASGTAVKEPVQITSADYKKLLTEWFTDRPFVESKYDFTGDSQTVVVNGEEIFGLKSSMNVVAVY